MKKLTAILRWALVLKIKNFKKHLTSQKWCSIILAYFKSNDGISRFEEGTESRRLVWADPEKLRQLVPELSLWNNSKMLRMPRYHGYGLFEPDERSAYADNRGGTAKRRISSLRLVSVSGFFVL